MENGGPSCASTAVQHHAKTTTLIAAENNRSTAP
jgi:hypothetical protein